MGNKPPLKDVTTTSRRFYLERSRDPSGVSGIGKVADGCEFPSGKIAIAWRGGWPSVAIYDSMKHVLAVHGHGGDTQVVWLDEWPDGQQRLTPYNINMYRSAGHKDGNMAAHLDMGHSIDMSRDNPVQCSCGSVSGLKGVGDG